jgi:hypothetical protein
VKVTAEDEKATYDEEEKMSHRDPRSRIVNLNSSGNISISEQQYDAFSSISAVDTCLSGCASSTDRFQFWEDDDFDVNKTAYTLAVQTGDITDQVLTVFSSEEFKEEVGITVDYATVQVYDSGSWVPVALLLLLIVGCFFIFCCYFHFKNKREGPKTGVATME